MVGYNRRSFLKVSGAVLGGIAVGSTVTAATSSERFLVDAKKTSASAADAAGLDVVYDLHEIDTLVVEGSESDVRSLGADYAPDALYSLDLPVEEQAPITVEDAATAESASARDEPYYPLQWDKQAQSVPEAHEITQGEGTRVAVIDSGITASHPDLEHAVNEELSRNFSGDDLGAGGPYGGYHGTHVAGIVAANDDNEVGVVGTAPETELVDCRVFPYDDEGASFASIVAAIVYSARIDCDAANLSLGAYPVPKTETKELFGKTIKRATHFARKQGTLVVVAAGNDAADLQHDGNLVSVPAEASNVVSVSATGPIGFNWGEEGLESPTYTPAVYTNYGTNAIDVAAPGGNYDPEAYANETPGWFYDLVLNTVGEYTEVDEDGTPVEESLTTSYSWVAGTSMAAPQVAGIAALVRSRNPDYHAKKVRKAIRESATVPEEFDKTYYGAGVVDALDALE